MFFFGPHFIFYNNRVGNFWFFLFVGNILLQRDVLISNDFYMLNIYSAYIRCFILVHLEFSPFLSPPQVWFGGCFVFYCLLYFIVLFISVFLYSVYFCSLAAKKPQEIWRNNTILIYIIYKLVFSDMLLLYWEVSLWLIPLIILFSVYLFLKIY